MNTTETGNAKADAAEAEYGTSTKATKKKATKAKGGRPKGAKTKARAAVQKIIARDACPACGCKKEPAGKQLLREGPASGTALGKPYSYYRHYTCKCAGCGRAFIMSEYDQVTDQVAQET